MALKIHIISIWGTNYQKIEIHTISILRDGENLHHFMFCHIVCNISLVIGYRRLHTSANMNSMKSMNSANVDNDSSE